MKSRSRNAALAAFALIAAVTPAVARADGWTLAHARAFGAHARVSGVDDTQADRPTFTLDLRRARVEPRGRPSVHNRVKTWRAFDVSASGVDPDTGLTLDVSFLLHLLGG